MVAEKQPSSLEREIAENDGHRNDHERACSEQKSLRDILLNVRAAGRTRNQSASILPWGGVSPD
jgi:hypothetical protein